MGSQELSKYNVGVTLDCEIFANFDDVANKTNTTRETLRTCYVYIQTFSTFPRGLKHYMHSYINKNSSNLGKSNCESLNLYWFHEKTMNFNLENWCIW